MFGAILAELANVPHLSALQPPKRATVDPLLTGVRCYPGRRRWKWPFARSSIASVASRERLQPGRTASGFVGRRAARALTEHCTEDVRGPLVCGFEELRVEVQRR